MAGLACVALVTLMGCAPAPKVPTPADPAADTSAPLLRLGSAGLRRDLTLDQASTEPQQRRAKRDAEILLSATAEDAQSGIRSVTLDITVQRVCNGVGTHRNFSETQPAPASADGLPQRLTRSFVLRLGPERFCAEGESRVTVSVVASAENGVGRQTVLQPGRISSFGPDLLRVATFNMFAPGNHADSVYERWGRSLASLADVIVMTEMPDSRRAALVAQAAGLPHVLQMPNGDVAIAARGELSNPVSRIIDPPGRLSSNNSNIFSVMADLGGTPHQIIGTHWGIRDANDEAFGAERSAPGRLQAAQVILGLLAADHIPAFVAGDMNAYSGAGPQDHDGRADTPDLTGSTAEMDALLTRFSDPFRMLGLGNDRYCSNQRIDYVFARGPYVPLKHEACFADATPSDHPYVLVTYEAGDL